MGRGRVARTGRRIAGAVAAAFLLWLLAVWPPPSWYRHHDPRETAFMALRDRQGREPVRRHTPVSLDAVTPALRRAVIVAEDHRFEQHRGVDYQALREALGYRRPDFGWRSSDDWSELWRAATGTWSRRERVRGASTITMQLAKNLYLSPSRNPIRKVKEAVTAWRLEAALEKDRILELYLNVVELGPGIWGVEAASQVYFRRPASQLTVAQAALLAATLPQPLTANPADRVHTIRWRQRWILGRM